MARRRRNPACPIEFQIEIATPYGLEMTVTETFSARPKGRVAGGLNSRYFLEGWSADGARSGISTIARVPFPSSDESVKLPPRTLTR